MDTHTSPVIVVNITGDQLGDLTGYDEERSDERFAGLVEAAIEAAYPEADVRVRLDTRTVGRGAPPVAVHGTGSSAEDEAVLRAVEAIVGRVFVTGDWAVES
jgi:hypothetical protein